jgi:integrase
LSWQQIAEGLASGSIYLPATITKTGVARAVPLEPNLIEWLNKYRRASGLVLPEQYGGKNIDGITRVLRKQSGVTWRDNAPRHSYASYCLARGDAPASVTSAMGHSLQMLQKHYWARSKNLTKAAAQEWFAIRPDDCASAEERNQESTADQLVESVL